MTDDQQSDKAQADIDRSLLRAYDEMINEDLPDRFKVLLEMLRSGEAIVADNEDEKPSEPKE
ncbi:MAG: regulator [Rhodobacteraceae bacterium]|nr:regulator [Paracoccaceae bacterium]